MGMRRILFPASLLAVLALLVVPQALIAHRPTGGSALDEQTFKFRGRDVSTASRAWRNVPGFRFRVCAVREVSADVNLVLRGAPASIRIRIDGTDEGIAHPGPVAFSPRRGRVFSFTFAEEIFAFEGDDLHNVDLQWRSPTGRRVTLKKGMANLFFERAFGGPACEA